MKTAAKIIAVLALLFAFAVLAVNFSYSFSNPLATDVQVFQRFFGWNIAAIAVPVMSMALYAVLIGRIGYIRDRLLIYAMEYRPIRDGITRMKAGGPLDEIDRIRLSALERELSQIGKDILRLARELPADEVPEGIRDVLGDAALRAIERGRQKAR